MREGAPKRSGQRAWAGASLAGLPEVRCFVRRAWGGAKVEPAAPVAPRPGRDPLRFVPQGWAGLGGLGRGDWEAELGVGRCGVGGGGCCPGGVIAQECFLGLFKVRVRSD